MGFRKNTNAWKEECESIAPRTFEFKRVLSNDSKVPHENFSNAFNFKGSFYFTPKEFL